MYEELFHVWKNEVDNTDLQKLPTDFYSRIADYVRRLKEEGRMLDRRSVKASLLKKEVQNVKHMIRELIQTRCTKIFKKAARTEKITHDLLAIEEERICVNASSFSEEFQRLAKDVLRGCIPKIGASQSQRKAVLRFVKEIPAIIGSDMKTYGPFKIEDVASLPIENAKIIVKQGSAEEIET